MARNSPPKKGDYEPDWTEQELEEKLNALRARRGGNKSARFDADMTKHGIELNFDSKYARGEAEDFEPLGDDEYDEDPNSKAISLARVLQDNGEWEELEQLAKVQIMMDPRNAKEWRLLGKKAAKARRLQRPRVVRFLLALTKALVGIFALLAVAVIIGAIIGAFLHH